MELDLTDLLTRVPAHKAKNKNSKDTFDDLLEPKLPRGAIICTFCKGTPPPDGTKCIKCKNAGFFFPTDIEIPISVVQWWSHYECACGECYSAPSFTNQIMIKYSRYRPIIKNGRLFGKKFLATEYRPAPAAFGETLPYEVQEHHHKIRACIKCAQDRMLLMLAYHPHTGDDNAQT